jgi:hypothetical protein
MAACYEYVSWRKKFAGNSALIAKDYAAGHPSRGGAGIYACGEAAEEIGFSR